MPSESVKPSPSHCAPTLFRATTPPSVSTMGYTPEMRATCDRDKHLRPAEEQRPQACPGCGATTVIDSQGIEQPSILEMVYRMQGLAGWIYWIVSF